VLGPPKIVLAPSKIILSLPASALFLLTATLIAVSTIQPFGNEIITWYGTVYSGYT